MKHLFAIFFCLFFYAFEVSSQEIYPFEASAEFQYGLPNPDAPKQILDFAPLIGESHCKSVTRNPDQTWADTVEMIWRFKYIMNGTAVQDETLKEDNFYAGSIRQYIEDSSRWYVHYYSSLSPTTVLPAWEGNRSDNGDIVLYRPQKAPNGMDGFYKINFMDMTDTSFYWLGEWVTTNESFSFPTWKISCKKMDGMNRDNDRAKIMENIASFSNAYENADYSYMANAYTTDGKIFPDNASIIEGREAIKARWTLPPGSSINHHKINPEEIHFIGQYAYDYGYYEGQSKNRAGEISDWKGKYVIVWKKVDGDWKMYLDIWNRVLN